MKKIIYWLDFTAFFSVGIQGVAFAQSGWNACEETAEQLPFFTKILTPSDMCSRLHFVEYLPTMLTAVERQSIPVKTIGQELLSFVDTESPIPSIHFIVWLGKLNPIYASRMPFLNFQSGAKGIFKSDWGYLANGTSFEVLIDGAVLRTQNGDPASNWIGTKWDSLVAGTQVVPFPTFGMALVSVLLSEEGRKFVDNELNAGAGLQALFQWRVVHNFDSPYGHYEAVSEGQFQCLSKSQTVLSESDASDLHPIMKILPVNVTNIRTLRSCK